MSGSTPSVVEFVPLPMQLQVIKDIDNFDYSLGTHEILLSGSVGSAKTILLAHLIIVHCLKYPGTVVGIGRRAMPDLKETLLQVILDHIEGIIPYDHNQVRHVITLPNGSVILPFSWADKKFKKFRSYEFSMFVIEEGSETDTPHFYEEIVMRVGRDKNVREKVVIMATNPDEPDHWIYKRFMSNPKPTRHVYYSVTKDNPYLPESYVAYLEENLDSKMARRMLRGEWLSVSQEVVYHAYNREHNFIAKPYVLQPFTPIHWSFDFNIGLGKPFSTCFFQFNESFHFFAEVVVEGSRTLDICEEAAGRGLLDAPVEYIINGDASGRHNDTRSKNSDYDIIKHFLDNYRTKDGRVIRYKINVPKANPPVRSRHNKANAWICNSKGVRRVFVYQDAKIVDKGFALTKLKSGGQYIEDDGPSQPHQHVSTAATYGICSTLEDLDRKPITSRQR